MIKKLLLLLITLVPAIAGAQAVTDSWRIHPFYAGANVQNVVDAGDRVYYLASNNLFCYYKDTQENESLNRSNYLSDVTVGGIYYDASHKKLLVTYDNGNLDVIDKDGRVTNMPEIMISSISGVSKAIKHITFNDKYAYAATPFGYVVIDTENAVVKESRIYMKDIESAIRVGSWMVIANNGRVLIGRADEYRETMDKYKDASLYRPNIQFTPVDDTHFLLASTRSLELCTINEDGSLTLKTVNNASTRNVSMAGATFMGCCPETSSYITFDAQGENLQSHDVASGELVGSHDGKEVWGINDKGLHKVGDEAAYYMPISIGIATNAYYTAYNPGEKKLYLKSSSDNMILSSANKGAKTEIWTYDGTTWEDVTPADVPLYNNGVDGYQGSYQQLFVPGTKNDYLCSTRAAGIMYVRDGKVLNNFYFDNMPREDKSKSSIGFDSQGNFYAVNSYHSDGKPTLQRPVMILPKAKLANPELVKTEDWITPAVPGIDVAAFKRSSFAISRESDVKVFTAGAYHGPLIIWNDNKNIKNLSPAVKSYAYNSLIDQDGQSFEWTYIRCLTPDTDGTVWMGYDRGVVKFDPAEAFKTGFHVTQFKVPRNDGTNLADYLLDGVEVNCITLDGSGRKWIGTNTAGLFLVSANGTQVLKSFNTTNSPIVSDCIYDVTCNSDNNSVYITTSKGVMEYFSDVVPASDDYSNIHVFPNPVRPENGSLVTIAGLMENSLCKITDSAGNVIKQLKSEGGMCTWDCCNDGGDRVSSGVYYVIASQNENGNGSSAVAKFVVIK